MAVYIAIAFSLCMIAGIVWMAIMLFPAIIGALGVCLVAWFSVGLFLGVIHVGSNPRSILSCRPKTLRETLLLIPTLLSACFLYGIQFTPFILIGAMILYTLAMVFRA